jgi:hypothetical protein
MKIANPEIRSIVAKAYLSGSACRQQLADIFGYHIGKKNGLAVFPAMRYIEVSD